MKNIRLPRRRLVQAFTLALFVLLPLTVLCQPALPPPPPDPWLFSDSFVDITNWSSDDGYFPSACSNLVSVPEWEGNALLLDTTNTSPACLAFNVVNPDGSTNIVFSAGAVCCVFICDWSSADTNQNGTGPGDAAGDSAYLLAAGDFSSGSPGGLWSISFDSGGNNIYFAGVSNFTTNVVVSAPISWSSNTIHLICLAYGATSTFYLDGQLSATGGGPVTIVPDTNACSNAFWIGSDSSAAEQARGVFWYLECDDASLLSQVSASYFTNQWGFISTGYDAWLAAQNGFGPDFQGPRFPPAPVPEGGSSSNSFVANTNYLNYTNFWLSVTNSRTNVFVTIDNTLSNLTYEILTNSSLASASTNWNIWQVLTASNGITPAPPMALGSTTMFFKGALALSTTTNGMADYWCMEYFNTLNVNPYADPDGDGLCNLDEYILGTNPTNAHSITPLHNDAQALLLAYTNYDTNCHYRLIVTNGPDTNTVLVTISPTLIGTNYQIYTEDQSDTNNTWRVETNFLGTNTATTVAISLNGRSLNYIGGYGEDSDGDSLPDGYEVLATLTDPYLPDTGITGTPDGYKDPDGDGYCNLQEMYNGTNPHVFDTPAGPQGLVADITDGGNTVTFTWQPASGPVLSYVVSIWENSTLVPIATNAATQLSYVLTDPAQYPGYDTAGYGLPFSVTALYAQGASSAIGGGLINYPAVAAITLINGPGGSTCLLSSGASSNVLGYTNFIWEQFSCTYPEYDQYAQPYNYYPPGSGEMDTNAYIPASQFTNGIAVLTEAQAPAYEVTGLFSPAYQYGYALLRGGGWCYLGAYEEANPAVPFIDGGTQMKQNIRFLLRAAPGNAGFSYTYPPYSFAYPKDYVYSTYYYIPYNIDEGYPPVYLDHFTPFEDNYFFRNFAFNASSLNTAGTDDTGFGQWEFYGYGPLTGVSPAFQFPTYDYVAISNQVPITAILPSDTTQWVGWFPGGAITQFGAYYSGGSWWMSNWANVYGLPYNSLAVVVSNQIDTLSPGNDVAGGYNSGSFYVGTAQPTLQTVDYYFARPNTDFMPGDGFFEVTNTTPPLMLGSVGNSMLIAGYAKQAVLNGYNNVFAYLGQYFTNAFVMSNGVVTTNPAGILSEYGEFFPTVPGQVAVMTKPDPDQTNIQGTCVVDIIRLSLDVNHDGIMDETYTGPDNTSYNTPFVFWANNDYDRWHTNLIDGVVQDGLQSASQPDYNYTDGSGKRAIPCPRDLEDYSRLWVSGVSNTLSRLPAGSTVTLSWAGYGSSPTIDLFQAADADGGIGYLTNLTTASNQVNNTLCRYVGRMGPGSNIVLNSSSYSNGWAGDHYIWCGVFQGSDQLNLTITDGSGNLLALSSQTIQIEDIKQMYERWTVGDNDDNKPLATVVPMTSPELVADSQPQFRYPYDAPYDTNDTYILFVHGYNVAAWEKDCFAETAYKRLYWQGYQGRFGEFRWPTYDSAALFEPSEREAWLSGTGLLNLLGTLNTNYPGKVYLLAHSLGNVVAGQALRQAGAAQVVNTYVASQAALSARAYDNAIPTDATSYYTPISPDSTGHYYTNTSPPYFNGIAGAGTFVNFINSSDWALMGDNLFAGHPGWLEIQQGKLLLTTQTGLGNYQDYWYTTPSSNHPSGYYFQNGPICPYRNLLFTNDTFEIFSEAAQSYSLALGAETASVNHFNALLSVNLFGLPYNFGDTHYGHSLEFRSDNMTTDLYWQRLLLSFGLKN